MPPHKEDHCEECDAQIKALQAQIAILQAAVDDLVRRYCPSGPVELPPF